MYAFRRTTSLIFWGRETMKDLCHKVSQFLWMECRGYARDILCGYDTKRHVLARDALQNGDVSWEQPLCVGERTTDERRTELQRRSHARCGAGVGDKPDKAVVVFVNTGSAASPSLAPRSRT